MRYVGIDVSKKTLQVAMLEPSWNKVFTNTPAGRRAISDKLRGQATRVVLEATATYGEDVAHLLHELPDVEVVVANPRRTKAFAKALDQRGKSDMLDSEMLARFALSMPCNPWSPPDPAARALRDWVRRRRQLVEQRTAEKARLIELRSVGHSDPEVMADIKAHIRYLDGRIEGIETHLKGHVEAHPDLQSWREQLLTIPGVGDVTALGIMSELVHLPDDMDIRQRVAYAGLDPLPHQSGTMDARRRISKRGSAALRTTLYLAAWNVKRSCPEVRAWGDKLLARGKKKNVVNIAVARKLLHAIEGMRRSGTAWDARRFGGGRSESA